MEKNWSLEGESSMSSAYRSRLLQNLRITRVLFGLALSALAMVVWLRVDMSQLWLNFPRTNPVVNLSDSNFAVNFSNVADPGCLSRSQQYRYRKHEFEIPMSESLTTALTEYTKMVSHCAHDAKPGCQYVVYYEGWEGLGNRLLSLVTAFAYALVTKRGLVTFANRGHLPQLLCEPFPNTSWVLPSPVANTVLSQAVSLDDAMTSRFVNVSAVHVNLRHSHSAGAGAFFRAETQRSLRNVTWVIWESNQYYIPRLFMLSDYWMTLKQWFPDVSHVFTQLGRVLCVPRNEVWETIQALQDAERVQVGIQVRRHGVSDNASFSDTAYDRIVTCVEDVVRARVSVLVTSLQSVYWEKMRERWHGSPEVKFVMVSHEGREQYSLEQARKAMVEIWLLSFCNTALATSSWSTFGYVAQALAGIRPRILNIRGEELLETEPACSYGQSSEPCLHYPFTDAPISSSGSNSTTPSEHEPPISPSSSNSTALPTVAHSEHELWVARHILSCQDEAHGLQLVSL